MSSLSDHLRESDERRKRDAERFAQLAEDACQLCDAHGEDKRSLWLSCFYAIHEVVPEMIDTEEVADLPDDVRNMSLYTLRICKSCRASFLGHLQAWRDERVALRGRPKDHDGHLEDDGPTEDRNIPLRVNGAIQWLTREEWEAWLTGGGVTTPGRLVRRLPA